MSREWLSEEWVEKFDNKNHTMILGLCRSTNHLWAMDIAKSSHLASNLTFAWRRPTSILRVLGTVIIQSARLWVVDNCSETDVLDGEPREDEDDDERAGDSIEPIYGDGGLCLWRKTLTRVWLGFNWLFLVVCQHLLPTIQRIFSIQPPSDACSTNAPCYY